MLQKIVKTAKRLQLVLFAIIALGGFIALSSFKASKKLTGTPITVKIKTTSQGSGWICQSGYYEEFYTDVPYNLYHFTSGARLFFDEDCTMPLDNYYVEVVSPTNGEYYELDNGVVGSAIGSCE